jgi:LDH2 family malate/lactate/ureidoglycolate dehydrogenase
MKYTVDSLRAFGTEVAQKLGMSEVDADILMQNLLLSDMRGIRSHGMTKLIGYITRIELGITSATAQPTMTMDHGAVFAMNGNNGMGSTIGSATMKECIRRAKNFGVSFATVNNASHYGFGGYYAMMASKENMIGFTICNTPALVAPFGGANAMIGTNPLSVAIPAGKHPDLVMDMATSMVAKGKIALALKEGKSIPDNWALDSNGNPTTDPAAANTGALMPLGGAKGYALALIIDVICSCLAGGKNSRQIQRMFENPTEPSGVGYFMGAIDISKFLDVEEFKARTDTMFDEIKAGKPAPGFHEIMIPGEIEYNLTQKNKLEGIEISDATLKEFQHISESYHVPMSLLETC